MLIDHRTRHSPTRQEATRAVVPQRNEPSQSAVNANSQAAGSSYSSYQTAEERAAFIKRQAEQRMAERLAALGLKPPPKTGSPVSQDTEKERSERDRRLKQDEEQEAKRDQERQRRLADETPAPPSVTKPLGGKKPPPPPSRGARGAIANQQAEVKRKSDQAATRQKEQEEREMAIKAQQEAQEAQTRQLQYVFLPSLEPNGTN